MGDPFCDAAPDRKKPFLGYVVSIALALCALTTGLPPATAQDATEQASINGMQRGLASRAYVFTCEGLIPAWNAATTALGFLDSVNNVGKGGEWLISKATGATKNTQTFGGRIPDFITENEWIESKNVASLSYTKQIEETAALARSQGKVYTIITRVNTKISQNLLMKAALNKSLRIIQCLPNVL